MISCNIGGTTFTRSLLDTGTSVHILLKGKYDTCPLGELQPLFIEFSLADRSVRQLITHKSMTFNSEFS